MSHTILKAVLGTLLIIVSVLAIGGRRSTVLPGHPSQSQPGAFSTQSDGQGSLVVRADGDECQRRLQDWEREIRADGRGWRAENRKTGLTATFDRRGMEVRPATPDQDWRWGLELVSYGVGDHQVVVGDRASQVRTAGQQVSYDWDANLEEWYRNDEKGLEHGYTIRRRPDSALTPDSAPTKDGQAEGALALRLRTRGGLNVLGQVSGRELHFAEPEGDGVLTYGDLKVFDATGRELNAWFELEPEGGFQVLVEDSGATYPLTVDPHISQARGLAASRHSVALAPVPQTATQLVITTQPVAGASGAVLAPQPVLEFRDSNNVKVTSAATVAVAVVGADGVLSGTVTVPAAAGVAKFTNLSLAGKVGTSYKLVFSSSGLLSADSAALTVTAGAAAKLTITTQPVAAASGADLLPQPSVKLKDAQDNDVTTNGIVVTASIEPGTSGGQVSGNVTATTNSSGVATFTGLKLAGVIGTNYRLRFSATSLTPAVSNNLAVTGAGTATQLVVTTQPLGAPSGDLLVTQPVVEIRDSGGNKVNSSASVIAAVNNNGTLSGTSTVSATNGVATFTNLRLSGKVGTSYTLNFTSSSLTGSSNSVTVTVGAAAQLAITTQPVGGSSGGILATQPVLAVQDSGGNLVSTSILPVTASVSPGSGKLGGNSAVTAVAGVVSFSNLTLAGIAGTSYTIIFSATGLATATSNSVVVTPGAATKLTINTQPSTTGTSGDVLSTQPVVQIQDAEGNIVTNSTAPVTAKVSPGGILGGTTTVNAVNGEATFTDLTLAGLKSTSYTIEFLSSPLGLICPTSSPLWITKAGAAVRLGIKTKPVAALSGSILSNQPVIEIRDSGGNLASSPHPISVDIMSGAGGNLLGTTMVTASSGTATFTDLVLNGTVGVPYTLRFTSSSTSPILTPAVSDAVYVTGVGPATQLVIVTQPVAGASGAQLTTQPVVAIRDAGNNTVTNVNSNISVAIALGGGGSIAGTQSITPINGIATFTNLSFIGSTSIDYVLQFASPGLASTNSNAIRVTGSGTASKLVIKTQPVGGNSGATLATQPVVEIQDAGGNIVSSSSLPVTVAIFSGTGGAVNGTTTVNATAGVTAFSNLSLIGKVSTNYVLRFSAPNLIPIDSANVTVAGAGAASQLAITTQPVGGASGAALATLPVVEVRDSGGNKVATSTASITASIQSGASGTLTGTLTVAATAGVATFSDLKLTGVVSNNYTIRFSSPGLISAISNNVGVTSGTKYQLAITTQPVGSASGSVLSTQPVVEIRDALGNRVTTSTDTVTVSISSGTGGVLSGTTAINAVGGVATFTNLVLTGTSGIDYQLQFASSGLIFATSSPIVISAGTATQIAITTQPTGGASGGLLLVQPKVEIRDAQGNRVINSSVAVTVAIGSGAGGTLSGTTTVSTAAGIATFTNLTLAGSTGTNYTLRFSTSALPSAESNNVTITPGAPARLAVSTQPTGAASGAQLTNQPVVLVLDAQNNTVTTSTAPVTVSIFSGGGVLGGTLTVNAVAGVATFNNLTLAGLISSSYVLRFTSPSLTTADSNSLNLSGPGTATQLILTTQPVPGPSGTPFTTQPALEIRDSGGNVVTNSTATVTATILSNPDGRGLLTGNAPVNATGGLVNFSGLALAGKIGTSYVVQFSSSGMTSANSNSLSVTGAGAASVLEIVSQPVAGASGTPLSSQPAVAVRDTGGNTITSSAEQVSVSISSGTGGTLTGTTSINANNGVAVFSGLTLAGIVGTNYKFIFTACCKPLMSVTSDNVTVTPGTPGKLVITTNPVAGFSGGLMTTPAIVAIRDAQGNATGSSAPVSVSILTGSGGTLGGATTVNAINGIATFSNLTLAGTVGTNYVLRFTSTGTSSADSTVVTVTSGVPSRLALLTQPVGGISGQAMTTQPVVEIRDAQGNKVSGSTMPITASITVGGGGILGGQTTVSAVDGIATFNDLSLAGVIGTSYVIRFSTGAITSVSSSGVTVTGPGAPSQLVLTVQPVGGPSGAAMLTQPVITIRDSGGNTVTTSTASVTVELFSGTGGSLTGTKMINAINGQAAFTNLVLAGTINTNYVLQFTSTGLSPINSNNIRVTHGAATQLMVLTQPVGGGSGLTLAAQPVIGIVDAQNNIVTSSTAAVTVGLQSGSGTLGGGALTVTASNGVATFAGVTLSGSVGTVYLLNFSSGSLTSVNSNNVTLIPGAATQLAIATAPVGGGSGALLSTQPVITLQDAQGNTSTSTATVSVAIQSGTGGTLGGTLSVVAVNGVATFTNLTLSGLVGTNYVLRFTSGALTRVDSGFVTVSVGAPTRLAITTQPVAGISGGLMTTPPVVEVRDSGNNLVPTATPEVTVNIVNGQGGSLGGTTTVFAVNGVASFSGLTFAGALGTNYVLRFTSSGITFAGVSTGGVTVNSDNVAVTAVGAASKLAIKIPPVGGPSGSALLNQPVVVVQDPGGNTVNSIAKTVTVDLVSGTGLTGTKSVQTVAGEATFTNLVLAGLVSTNYALRFTADGLTSVDSPSFTLQPGQPTQLALVTPPVAGASGELMTTFPVVAIRDAQGNTVTSSTTAVTVEVFSGADGSLSGQTTVNAVNGVATFSNLRLAGKITNAYVLRFTSGSLSSVNSAGLTVTPGPAAQLEITAQPIAGVSGAALATQPQVVIRDAQGNLINSSTATVTVALASNLSPGQISGTTTVTAASGVATFTNLAFAGLINTNYNFRFTSGSLTPVNSQQVIVTGVGPASQLVITTQPVGGASGAVLVTQPIVAIRDAGGNNLTENLPVSVEIGSGAGGQLTGVTTVNAQNGV
ncbi:MAG: hypothetical protein EBU88_03335, partial [Acidobacteria bacterium]|nr:hypothetical protein [Acidobacteriota bacterium]